MRRAFLPFALLCLCLVLTPFLPETSLAAASPPRQTELGIAFEFHAPEATAVYLAGEFNNWSADAEPMTKGEDGIFRVAKKLAPGSYEYKFVVDGTWKEDPANPAKISDPYGGFNSVVVVLEGGEVSLEVVKPPSPPPAVEQISASGRPIYLAIVWHQHQPRYERNPESGEYLEPWVRLHCAKDYYDMAAMVTEFEGIKYSINLTPVLLSQIEDILAGHENGGPTDRMLRLSAKPAQELTKEDKLFLLARFFDANWSHQIDPFPRYKELRDRRLGFSTEELTGSIELYSVQDFLDLQVWFNLAWLDPDFLEGPVELPSGTAIDLSGIAEKAQGFTEAEKGTVLEAHIDIMRNVVAIHKSLQDEGRIEVTTTPFYHPILPLIYDTELAAVSMPAAKLPAERFSFPDDARAHVTRAVSFYEERFGRKPVGMWPAEGAVAQEIIGAVASAGFEWMATDAENLAFSLGKTELSSSERFSIYRGSDEGQSLALVFRDTGLSNDISFRFSKMDPVEAANDFIGNLSNIQKSLSGSDRDHIVVVILDGENAWDSYENDGKDFFRSLYSQLSEAEWVRTTTVSEFLQDHPLESLPALEKLWAGSWDGHSFATWIGEPEENLGWEYLTRARKEFEDWEGSEGVNEEDRARTFELLLAAEGSDWFWWYGKDKDSGGDDRFDEAFRNTLKQVYTMMARKAPEYLDETIIGAGVVPVKLVGGEKEIILLSIDDPLGDDNGPGTYTYPTNPVFLDGAYDIERFEISHDEADVFFRFFIAGELTAPWGGDVGFCLQGVDIYVDTDGEPGSGAKELFGARNAQASTDSQWEYSVMANMDEVALYDSSMRPVAGAKVGAGGDAATRSIVVKVPKEFVGEPDAKWRVIACLVGHDGYGPGFVRPITPVAQEWTFGGSRNPTLEPKLIDLIVPPGAEQGDILGAFQGTGRVVEIPGMKVVGE
jgi:alpha-amylase/alpha-mannosidase (GH57 family)